MASKKPAKKQAWSAPTSFLKSKTVLITGGTGTFGRAFIQRLFKVPGLAKLIVFSRDELKQSELAADYRDEPRLRFFIGDIRDPERLKRALEGVDIVVHAAALKRVEAIEYNPFEAIQTNVVGSKNVIDAAIDRKVGKVLLVSSDKAVEPINLYGATKMSAEKLFVAANVYAGMGTTALSVVRYGNVIGSRGSFVELVERQRENGSITVTDRHMTRFWIRIEQVIDIVLETLALMQGGEIFIPKMKNMPITDVVKLLAPSCKVEVIGARPGEKLHETLMTKYEVKYARELPRLFVITPRAGGGPVWLKRSRMVPDNFLYTSDNKKFLLSRKEAAELFAK
ncbi:TPA: UDP-N-acetylglucosamine 4,6-dehydratase (inverting) [Candidatus Kaiserbacteria bacterium]|nr:MAG: UDP-N-acetylglucosamine 4,6-dehydratase [Parcubacteria group bacterium GW2011_GWA1_56_13]KKW46328.1 MAG: UDP-N-acetylglucosamine 4,6-dehydratase [Parcubacteria group bacterium GW2011_GWB1_57_6]HCR52255.1 UDP-N-acetylglucosamine 4,6-dehydratase (inverting) [Candidatus Kaiserbacteria bacterium]